MVCGFAQFTACVLACVIRVGSNVSWAKWHGRLGTLRYPNLWSAQCSL